MLLRFLAVACVAVGVFGSIGGGDMGIYGAFRACVQAMFFLALAVVFHLGAELWDHYRFEQKRKRQKQLNK